MMQDKDGEKAAVCTAVELCGVDLTLRLPGRTHPPNGAFDDVRHRREGGAVKLSSKFRNIHGWAKAQKRASEQAIGSVDVSGNHRRTGAHGDE